MRRRPADTPDTPRAHGHRFKFRAPTINSGTSHRVRPSRALVSLTALLQLLSVLTEQRAATAAAGRPIAKARAASVRPVRVAAEPPVMVANRTKQRLIFPATQYALTTLAGHLHLAYFGSFDLRSGTAVTPRSVQLPGCRLLTARVKALTSRPSYPTSCRRKSK